MSNNHPNYWTNGRYAQPIVVNPPKGQRVNNARHALWHFSRLIQVEVYPQGAWRKEDGRFDRGQATLIPMWATVQPVAGRNVLKSSLSEGESFEAEVIVHIDSHQPENIQIAQGFPQLFPDGLFLAGVGKSFMFESRGFGMLVQWRGLRWRVNDVDMFEYGGDEEVSISNAVYRGRCTLFTDIQQEMNADVSTEVIAP